MSTPAVTVPAWVVVGAAAVIAKRRRMLEPAQWSIATITSVGKRYVVTQRTQGDDPRYWDMAYPDKDTGALPERGTRWASEVGLYPLDSPDAAKIRQQAERDAAKARADRLAWKFQREPTPVLARDLRLALDAYLDAERRAQREGA